MNKGDVFVDDEVDSSVPSLLLWVLQYVKKNKKLMKTVIFKQVLSAFSNDG